MSSKLQNLLDCSRYVNMFFGLSFPVKSFNLFVNLVTFVSAGCPKPSLKAPGMFWKTFCSHSPGG